MSIDRKASIQLEPNYYEILGVEQDATAEQIKAAYRQLVKLYNPTKIRDSTESIERLKLINKANEVLSDEETRTKYDKSLIAENNIHSASSMKKTHKDARIDFLFEGADRLTDHRATVGFAGTNEKIVCEGGRYPTISIHDSDHIRQYSLSSDTEFRGLFEKIYRIMIDEDFKDRREQLDRIQSSKSITHMSESEMNRVLELLEKDRQQAVDSLKDLDVRGTPALRAHYDVLFSDYRHPKYHSVQNVSIYCHSSMSFTTRDGPPHLYLSGATLLEADREINADFYYKLKSAIETELRGVESLPGSRRELKS